MLDIVGKRYWFFLISGLLILISIISLAVFGLKPSIDFTGGSVLNIKFDSPVKYADVVQKINSLGYDNAIVQQNLDSPNEFVIRTEQLSDQQKTDLEGGLQTTFGNLTESSSRSITKESAFSTARKAAIAVAIAMIGMLLYVTYAFRKMPSPFRWGTCFVVALFHDIFVTVGLFSLLGKIFGWEMDLMFITGILAIVGVSLDNTIVVFDRMRENQRTGVSADFGVVVNRSQIETISRSLNTSITILIACLALVFFVGGSIQNFVTVLMIGIIAGTFDSVFVAPSLLVVWDRKEWGRFIGRKPVLAEAKGK